MVAVLGVGFWRLDAWLLDGLTGTLFALSGEDTVYAPGYSTSGFRAVRPGATEAEVIDLIGLPLSEVWIYETASGDSERVIFESSRVVAFIPDEAEISDALTVGLSYREVVELVGATSKNWIYSKARNNGSYRVRLLKLEAGRIVEKNHEFYLD
ncbi:MAG: hypothetical protein GY722_24780 [bacterium]|nr:hypothetical protein [bacterium]